MKRNNAHDLPEDLRRAGRRAAVALTTFNRWLGDRLQDMAMWVVNLVRDLPVRAGRLILVLWQGVRGLILAPLRAWQAATAEAGPGLRHWLHCVPRNVGIWLIVLLFRLLDLLGVPELWSLLLRTVSHVTPLTGEEIGAAAVILGPTAIRYADVRVAEGGVLNLIFARNGQRAFATFHTVNLPTTGRHCRAHFDILLHELVHVYQYERTGGLYIAEAIYAQKTAGYQYGDLNDLKQCLASGACYRDFNREQQAQLVQDYYLLLQKEQLEEILTMYGPFIAEMREGKI